MACDFDKRFSDFAPSGVFGVKDTAGRMAAFFSEGVACGVLFVFVEFGSPSDEFFDRLCCFC